MIVARRRGATCSTRLEALIPWTSAGRIAATIAVVLVAAVAGPAVGLAWGATSDGAAQIDGCRVIDQPGTYEVTSDVTAYESGSCIEIRASDVTLAGGGHRIEAAEDVSALIEIAPDAGGSLSAVTVRNVELVRGGIHVRSSSDVVLERVEVRDAPGWGIAVDSSTGAVVEEVRIEGAGKGIRLAVTTESRVLDSVIRRTGGTGIRIDKADGNLVRNTTIRRTASDDGIAVWFASDNEIVANTIEGAANFGIRFDGSDDDGSDGNLVRDNVIVGNRDGIKAQEAADTTIENNTVADNEEHGIRLILPTTETFRIVDNTVKDNGEHGIKLRGTSNHLLRGNVVTDNGGHGIAFEDTRRVVVESTTVSGNGEWGIHLTDRSAENVFSEARIGPDTVVSFEGRDVAVRGVDEEATLAIIRDDDRFSRYFQVTGTGENARIDLSVHYPDAVDAEGDLMVYRYRGSWTPFRDAAVDPAANVVTLSLAAFPADTYYALNLPTTGSAPSKRRTATPTPAVTAASGTTAGPSTGTEPTARAGDDEDGGKPPQTTSETPPTTEAAAQETTAPAAGEGASGRRTTEGFQRGFFRNDGGGSLAFFDEVTLTMIGIVLSIAGIVVEMLGLRGGRGRGR